MKPKGFKNLFTEYSLMIICIVIIILLTTQYYYSYQMVLDFAKKRFSHLAKQSSLIIKEKDTQARETVSILGHTEIVNTQDGFEKKEQTILRLFATPMLHNNKIFSVYVGYPNRNYLEVVNVRHSPAVSKMFNVPAGARWIVVKVLRERPEQEIATRISHFYDENFNYLSDLKETTHFDPIKRPWYLDAMKHKGEVVRSEIYQFYRLKEMGITYSMALKDGKSVLAMDVTLEGLSQFLQELKASTNTEIYIIENGKVIASSEGQSAKLDEKFLERIQSSPNTVITFQEGSREYLSMAVPVSSSNGSPPVLITFKVDKSQMMQPHITTIFMEIWITLLVILFLIPFIRYLSRKYLKSIDLLMSENEKVKRREFENVSSIQSDILELNQLSDSLVEMAQSIKKHEQKQEQLLEAFIHLIGDIIDAKSPYTGQHSKRVPLLTKMLLQEANKAEEGSLGSFSITDDEILKGIEWSAWLHDCGKLVVPDYIIDKATKLETVYNRIHEIRTRFEVLLRDEKIRSLEAILQGANPEKEEKRYQKSKAKLQEDFEFIAAMNIGDRQITNEELERLKKLSEITWERHFKKTVGISWQERERINLPDEESLPAREKLLSDGPEFQIPRKFSDYQLYRKEEVRMEIPALLYHYGELYNLCIPIGTITAEEKFKIQEHAIHTLRILRELPWNDKLRPVIEDAANHHEYLDGTGYPRSLDEKQLTIPARIMMIADIFEALTSTDRPYKRTKTLSQALWIMVDMVQSHKIDGELFSLFITSKVYLQYAESHLAPYQIDLDQINETEIIAAIQSIHSFQKSN